MQPCGVFWHNSTASCQGRLQTNRTRSFAKTGSKQTHKEIDQLIEDKTLKGKFFAPFCPRRSNPCPRDSQRRSERPRHRPHLSMHTSSLFRLNSTVVIHHRLSRQAWGNGRTRRKGGNLSHRGCGSSECGTPLRTRPSRGS
jgi:hypothetical protein